MIFGCNLTFAIVENPEFKDLTKILRSAYKPPNRKLVGTEILDGVYSEVKKCLTNEIADKEVTLVQDGWSISQTQPVIAHSIHSGSNAYFFNAIAPSTATKDSEYCLSLLISAIDDCEKNHSCKVIGVVTDNCKVMLSLRAKLNNQRSDIFVYGCNAHYLNLVGQKLIPSDKIDSISAALTVANGKRPVVPGLTRWNSQIGCLENYIENHAIYLDILRRNPRKFDKDITKLINDFSLYTDAKQLKNAAKPISVALDKVQSNSSTLSEAVFEWIQLRNANLFKDDLALKYFQKKLDEAFSETALSAYILDPRYRGLLSEEKHLAYDWMDVLNDDLALLAMDLEAKNDQKFPSFLMRDDRLSKIDPRTFWNALKGNSTIDATACEIAQRLQKLPASGSSIERCFSTLNSIMTKTRNRLGIEKAGKLCTIHQSLRFMREDDW